MLEAFTLCVLGSRTYLKKNRHNLLCRLTTLDFCFHSFDVLMIHSILYAHKNFESKTNKEFWETTEL